MKTSEIFLEYVKPLMDDVTEDFSVEELQKTLRVPEMVWNSLVMQAWDQNKPNYIKTLYDQFKDTPAPYRKRSEEMINMWVKRKNDLFPEAKWAFEIKVRKGKAGTVIRAYTRIPDHLKHTVPKEWQEGNLRQLDFQS